MKTRKIIMALFFALFAVVGITTMTTLRGQNQSDRASRAQEAYDVSQYPTTNFSPLNLTTEPTTRLTDSQRQQQARGRRYNTRLNNPDHARLFAINENSSSGYGGFPTHARPEPALPIAESDLILVGEVTDAEAAISEDGTGIYSEFTIRVSSRLKTHSSLTVNDGELITAVRPGGAVRFPSGKIVWSVFEGKPFPRRGNQYVFFLKHNEEGQDFSIITAYELRGGRVFPLDGLDRDGGVVPELAAHQYYRGAEERAFLNEIRLSIGR